MRKIYYKLDKGELYEKNYGLTNTELEWSAENGKLSEEDAKELRKVL